MQHPTLRRPALLSTRPEAGFFVGYYRDDRGGCFELVLVGGVLLVCALLGLRLLIGLVPPGFW